jgi:hypothetical protein
MTEVNNRCEQLFPFFLKELPPELSQDFVAHLADCGICKEELKELHQIWQALPFEMDELEVPEAHKARMLENIMNGIQDQAADTKERLRPVAAKPQRSEASARMWKWWPLAAASILCLVVGAAVGWSINEHGRVQPATGETATAEPAQVVGQYALKAFNPEMPAASGNCLIKQQGQNKQLVVQVNGLGPTTGDQAYQLWIVKQGTRFNGGTFRVDEKGNGVLTHELDPVESPFETLGITLEPDALGIKPRGKKVLGT